MFILYCFLAVICLSALVLIILSMTYILDYLLRRPIIQHIMYSLHLGTGTNYYRYKHYGLRPITPEEQEAIHNFSTYGTPITAIYKAPLLARIFQLIFYTTITIIFSPFIILTLGFQFMMCVCSAHIPRGLLTWSIILAIVWVVIKGQGWVEGQYYSDGTGGGVGICVVVLRKCPTGTPLPHQKSPGKIPHK